MPAVIDYELFLHPLFGRLLEVHFKILAVSRPHAEVCMVRDQIRAAVDKINELSREFRPDPMQRSK